MREHEGVKIHSLSLEYQRIEINHPKSQKQAFKEA